MVVLKACLACDHVDDSLPADMLRVIRLDNRLDLRIPHYIRDVHRKRREQHQNNRLLCRKCRLQHPRLVGVAREVAGGSMGAVACEVGLLARPAAEAQMEDY